MNVRALIPLMAGLGVGGVALFLGINTLKNARAAQRPAAKVQLWAARENITRGTEIREDMLQPMAFPETLVPKGAFLKKEELIGRVPQLTAPAGLPILDSMLAPPGSKPGLLVKPGYRAVAVKIDASSGVDYHLEPGSCVDVVGSFKIRRDQRMETVARTIVENAEVAAVGPRINPTTGTEAEGKDRTKAIQAVTLLVRPEQVKQLLLAEQQGRIKLCLRGTTDTEELNDETMVSEQEVMGEKAARQESSPWNWVRKLLGQEPAAPSTPAATAAPTVPDAGAVVAGWVLRIYRGNKEELVSFKNADSCERVDARPAVAPLPTPSDGLEPPSFEPTARVPDTAPPTNEPGDETEPKEPAG